MEGVDFEKQKPSRLVLEGWVSIQAFAVGLSVFLVSVLTRWAPLGDHYYYWVTACGVCVYAATVCVLLLSAYGPAKARRPPPSSLRGVAGRAYFLGVVFGLGAALSLFPPPPSSSSWMARRLGVYACLLSFFHFSEYVATAASNPRTLHPDCFLLNHSAEYGVAAVMSWLEFAWWWWRFEAGRGHYPYPRPMAGGAFAAAGLALALGGDALRKAAMLTAGLSFNHVVQTGPRRAPGHALVTGGVYGYARHPAYAGWLCWSVGTQLLLGNPLCTLGYAVAGWRYLRSRVEEEEEALLRFFGPEYREYQRKVPSGLPFIWGVQSH